MDPHIWYVGEYSIAPGKTDTFKQVIKKAIALEQAEGEDVLNYEFFFNEDETKFYAIELFRDSEALLNHLERAGDIVTRVLEVAELTRFEIYGDPSKVLREAMATFGAKMYGRWTGFTRIQPTSIR